MTGRIKGLQTLVALLATCAFVAYSFYSGWTRGGSDFPSYYTAALLVRKGEQLPRLYDMPYFQRQMELAGIQNQLGGYIPQTPIAMLPIVLLTGLPVQSAKRIWLLANILLLGATLWLLKLMTGFRTFAILLLPLVCFGSLHTNLLLGQYYILVLFLITTGVFCLEHKYPALGGMFLALAFGLKLLTAPFFLYLAVRRQWRALAGMCAAAILLMIAAAAIFGWHGLVFYMTHILPRSLAGETLNPYNPSNGTFTTFLRRSFVSEAELNPHPLFDLPWLFFFLSPLLSLSVLWISIIAFARVASVSALGGFFISLLVLSPNTASYTFLLLLLPLALLMKQTTFRTGLGLLSLCFLLALPMRPSWNWMFPKVWLLAALFILAVVHWGQPLKRKALSFGLSGCLLAALLIATVNFSAYGKGANRRWDNITVERGAIYSSSPASVPGGIVYEFIGKERYLLRWSHRASIDQFVFPGQAFHPVALPGTNLVKFTLVDQRISKVLVLDTGTGMLHSPSRSELNAEGDPGLSPDGQWLVFTESLGGSTQLLIRAVGSGRTIQVTEGACNSFAPAWESDSTALLFASDCGRGLGLPALYRAPLSRILAAQFAGRRVHAEAGG